MAKTHDADGVKLHLAKPHNLSGDWVGQGEILKQVLACWLTVNEADMPLTPRLVGPPGIGKTALAMAAAEKRKQPLYIYQCILDEGNRMNEKSWASLAPLLDHRRYVESIVAGVSISSHPNFRCAVTMNQDESTFEIPDYILSRLQPTLRLQFPNRDDEKAILKYHLPFCPDDMLAMTVDFLQQSHDLQLDFSPRDGINLLRFAMKRISQESDHPLSSDEAWAEALHMCLGPEAADLGQMAQQKNQTLGGQVLPMGFGDFFFSADDPLHPELTPDDIDPGMLLPELRDEDLDDENSKDDDDDSDDGESFDF